MAKSAWRYCNTCHGLFWYQDDSQGVCPGGGGHQEIGYRFVLPFNQPETEVTQTNWRRCRQCRGLYYDGYPEKGRCPVGGGHVPSTSNNNYLLNHDIPGDDTLQRDWRFCGQCNGLFFDGYPEKGVCPAGGGHAAAGWNFVLPHAPEGSDVID